MCKYFLKGTCTIGKACLFSHQLQATDYKKLPCHAHAKGTCTFGAKCKYSHDKTVSAPATTTVALTTVVPSKTAKKKAAKKAKAKTTPFRMKGGVYVLDMWVPQESNYTGTKRTPEGAGESKPKEGRSGKDKEKDSDDMVLDTVWTVQNRKGRVRPAPF